MHNGLVEAFSILSKDIIWSWLIMFYISDIVSNKFYILPINILIDNMCKNKDQLLLQKGWITSNFNVVNLWDASLKEYNRLIREGYVLPSINQ